VVTVGHGDERTQGFRLGLRKLNYLIHENRRGGSSSHTAGEGTSHTNAYGGSTSHSYYGGTEHTNVYGGSTYGRYGSGAYHTYPSGATYYHPPT